MVTSGSPETGEEPTGAYKELIRGIRGLMWWLAMGFRIVTLDTLRGGQPEDVVVLTTELKVNAKELTDKTRTS